MEGNMKRSARRRLGVVYDENQVVDGLGKCLGLHTFTQDYTLATAC